MMNKRKLGEIEVSEIGLGCMGFSHGYGKVPEQEYSIEAIRKAYDYGCTFFDTAEGYGKEQFYPGHNEQLVGKAVHSFRQDIVLGTKLHISTEEFEEKGGLSHLEEIVTSHLQQSLKNLQTDYVDIYYLHRINEMIPVTEVAKVMGRLIDKGMIRGWGLSQVSVKTLDEAHKITPVTAVQNLYSMVERDCEKEIFPYCQENNIGVVAFSPTSSGLLSGKITTQTKFEGDDVRKWVPQLSKENLMENQPILDVLSAYATEKRATSAQIALAWMLHKYPNVVPIPGSKNKERIIENLSAYKVNLTDKEFQELEHALSACKIYGHRGHVESEQNTFRKNVK